MLSQWTLGVEGRGGRKGEGAGCVDAIKGRVRDAGPGGKAAWGLICFLCSQQLPFPALSSKNGLWRRRMSSLGWVRPHLWAVVILTDMASGVLAGLERGVEVWERGSGGRVDDSALAHTLGHHKGLVLQAVIHSTSICWMQVMCQVLGRQG